MISTLLHKLSISNIIIKNTHWCWNMCKKKIENKKLVDLDETVLNDAIICYRLRYVCPMFIMNYLLNKCYEAIQLRTD